METRRGAQHPDAGKVGDVQTQCCAFDAFISHDSVSRHDHLSHVTWLKHSELNGGELFVAKGSPAKSTSLPHLGRAFTDVQEARQASRLFRILKGTSDSGGRRLQFGEKDPCSLLAADRETYCLA